MRTIHNILIAEMALNCAFGLQQNTRNVYDEKPLNALNDLIHCIFYAKVFIFLLLQRHMAKSLSNYNCVIAGAVIVASVARFNAFQAEKNYIFLSAKCHFIHSCLFLVKQRSYYGYLYCGQMRCKLCYWALVLLSREMTGNMFSIRTPPHLPP